jgi:Fur family transcriptional regulator, ferric uptake regulator
VVASHELLEALGRTGHRLTTPRRALATLIAGREGHFTADDILAESRRARTGLGRATVFRGLDTLSDLGVIERLDLPNGDHAYVACRPAHHHHVVCSICGRSTSVEGCGMEEVAEQVVRRTGFVVDTHRIELYGTCRECRSTRPPAPPSPAPPSPAATARDA